MDRIVARTKRRRWRLSTIVWTLIPLAAVFVLIYTEQTALLYVLSTLAMCVLFIVVAFADLESRDQETDEKPDDKHTQPAESHLSSHVSAGANARQRKKGVA